MCHWQGSGKASGETPCRVLQIFLRLRPPPTTLSGYTPYSPQLYGPDLQLVKDLASAGVTVVAEGRIRTPGEMRQALDAGALAVTVGSAITRPELIAQGFLNVLELA